MLLKTTSSFDGHALQTQWRQASGLAVDQWLYERPPPADLASKLRCTWQGDIGCASTLLPDECIDMHWARGSIWVTGPETRSLPFSSRRGSIAVGVRFHPGANPLGVPASELRDRRVRLDQLWGDRAVHELLERVASRADDEGRAAELEDAVRRLDVRLLRVDEIALEAAVGLRTVRPASVRELARAVGLSERQLHRRCTAAFGYGPAFLQRIIRVQRFLRLARRHPASRGLADLALAAGYADQQHLTHEVHAILGTTPTAIRTPGDVRSTQDTARPSRDHDHGRRHASRLPSPQDDLMSSSASDRVQRRTSRRM
jgi:AraC-like DNA-binding protein